MSPLIDCETIDLPGIPDEWTLRTKSLINSNSEHCGVAEQSGELRDVVVPRVQYYRAPR